MITPGPSFLSDTSLPSLEPLKQMRGFIADQLGLLKSIKDSWQPADFLPRMDANWFDDIRQLRQRAEGLPDELLVVLVGNLVTEEALPSYQTWLNRIDGLGDETGADLTPWAQWSRGWTAEENRHGDVLNKYLFMTGRVDMRSVELTIQSLIRNGFDPLTFSDPYRSFVYTSFQERATKISHLNTGRLAERSGDASLGRICAAISGDEARHEEGYKRVFKKALEFDPARGVIAFADMMRSRISMPAKRMDDGAAHDVFAEFAIIAQRSGVYTTLDYAEVTEHLVEYWGIGALGGLSDEASEAQEFVCGLAARYREKAARIQEVLKDQPREPFPWIFDRKA